MDPFQDRIALNPMIEVSEDSGSPKPKGAGMGSLDANDDGEGWGFPDKGPQPIEVLDVTKAETQAAPANPHASWSADSQF